MATSLTLSVTASNTIKPIERCEHSTVVIGNKLYLWGGKIEGLPEFHNNAAKRNCISNIDILDLEVGQWENRPTKGEPHLGVVGYACTALDGSIMFFGGYCGHHQCYHNSVSELKIDRLTWRERSQTSTERNYPRKKAHCGAVLLTDKKQDYLLVVGGEGPMRFDSSRPTQTDTTNEQHLFKLSTDAWITPSSTGKCPPALSWFTCNKLADKNAAILYGGRCPDRISSDVYIVKLASEKLRWEKIESKYYNDAIKWPKARYSHAAVVLNAIVQKKSFLVISGGVGAHDAWILDIKDKTFQKIALPDVTVYRHDHSMSLYLDSANINCLVTFGGLQDILKLNDVIINKIEFEKVGKEWKLKPLPQDRSLSLPQNLDQTSLRMKRPVIGCTQINTAQTTLMAIENMEKDNAISQLEGQVQHKEQQQKEKDRVISQLQDQVQDKEQIQREFVQQYKESIASMQETMRSIIERNEELTRELENARSEMEQVRSEKEQAVSWVERVKREKEELERERDQLMRDLRNVTKEKEQIMNEKEQIMGGMEAIKREREEMERERARMYQQLSLNAETDGEKSLSSTVEDWVVEREEIVMLDEVIGTGAFGEVKMATFRGVRVAAKFLHKIIISEYNLHLFQREMRITSKLRHPHLVQFIGATKEKHPVILTELMPTSLSNELTNNQLGNQAILSISQDVACSLNYLHLWRPEAIIHRDVSSPNVLLEPVTSARQWKAKLSDFGSANIQSYTLTQVPGNPFYASPEAASPTEHSTAMDVYSFGLLMMEMCVHQPPGMTSNERQQQFASIKWLSMKQLIESCITNNRHQRPIMSVVLNKLLSLSLK